ncbi:MAG: polyhydroxyalkanoate depolymerase [Hyphomonadaceae bacterium]|nr:polyhydroxyalkanoate depolymerase [Hyphomonadaceae bacterium]
MLYDIYQTQADILLPFRAWARTAQAALGWVNGEPSHALLRRWRAALELTDRFTLSHERPPYAIGEVEVGGRMVPVLEEPALVTPFGTLLHFKKEMDAPQPRVLIVAPLSGHFATLLRNTVQTMVQDHDVYITDWHNARDVPTDDGEFHFADYIDHVIQFLEHLGEGAHVLAVCQPCVQVLAAAALMAAEKHPCQPLTMTLMGGPIDVRLSPTTVNALAFDHSIEWFEQNLITTVPLRYAGAGRRVYPGFVQLNAFMQMNMERHVEAHRRLREHLANGETEEANKIKEFYDEYFAVLDLPAEFYLETVDLVFQQASLAKGELTHRGKSIDPSKIKRTALLTVEGERDDVCALGQTAAAHDLCTGLRPYMKRHHMQTGVGHYGLFSGKRWEKQIYPIVRNLILLMEH